MDPFVNVTIRLVYRLDVKLVADRDGCEEGRLSILSNTTWASFYLQVQDRLGMESKGLQLFYKVRDMLYVSEPGFKRLQGEKDWADVMGAVNQAFQSYRDLELEVLQKVCSDISGPGHGLIDVKGY
jgi:hypothetical protein